MNYSEVAVNVITALKYCKGIGPAWINKNISALKDTNLLWERVSSSISNKELRFEDFLRYKESVQHAIEQDEYADGVTVLGDKDFPSISDSIKGGERPVALFYRGDISLLQNSSKNIAVIGVLNPTDEIIEREHKFVSVLTSAGYNIISGLAKGCDSIAHKQTLEQDGITIAILPSTLKNITPAENKQLANQIVSHQGLLVTEYFEEATSKKELVDRFIKRDRLQAMFSKAICLTASYAPNNQGNDSGSRHAMGKAKEYQIPRYVMYNKETDANNPLFDLNRSLLDDPNVRIITAKSLSEISHGTKPNPTLFENKN